jgi:uncharacterized membrane protein YtjA (UPF0391 family)
MVIWQREFPYFARRRPVVVRWNRKGTGGFQDNAAWRPMRQEEIMGNLLYWAVIFLIVALVAAFLGFGGVAGVATEGARILFWVAIILVVLAFIGSLLRRG